VPFRVLKNLGSFCCAPRRLYMRRCQAGSRTSAACVNGQTSHICSHNPSTDVRLNCTQVVHETPPGWQQGGVHTCSVPMYVLKMFCFDCTTCRLYMRRCQAGSRTSAACKKLVAFLCPECVPLSLCPTQVVYETAPLAAAERHNDVHKLSVLCMLKLF
jgi:hypothetical protein